MGAPDCALQLLKCVHQTAWRGEGRQEVRRSPIFISQSPCRLRGEAKKEAAPREYFLRMRCIERMPEFLHGKRAVKSDDNLKISWLHPVHYLAQHAALWLDCVLSARRAIESEDLVRAIAWSLYFSPNCRGSWRWLVSSVRMSSVPTCPAPRLGHVMFWRSPLKLRCC